MLVAPTPRQGACMLFETFIQWVMQLLFVLFKHSFFTLKERGMRLDAAYLGDC